MSEVPVEPTGKRAIDGNRETIITIDGHKRKSNC